MLLVLGDGVELVALWYGAKIGAVTAEAYTFLQPKDYAYYLDYTHGRRRGRGRIHARAGARGGWIEPLAAARARRRGARGAPPGEASFEALAAEAPEELEAAPTTRDDIALWKFTTGSTGLPKAAVTRSTARCSASTGTHAGARDDGGRRRASGAEALLRLRARPDRPVPVRRRRRRDRLPRADVARADLRARRAPPAEHPRRFRR